MKPVLPLFFIGGIWYNKKQFAALAAENKEGELRDAAVSRSDD